MRKLAAVMVVFLATSTVWAQSANDKRGFQGNVVSQTKNGKAEETTLQFTGRAIVVGNDTYDIVKKEFDGKSTTTFTCTKRRATFEIVFVAGESITITDTSDRTSATIYSSIKE
ncbi:MAG: hypothetical protein AB7K37_09905 [Cyclobacteriaceae bacterium]